MKIAIVYWSGSGNTEAMANAMLEGAKNAGAEVRLFEVRDYNYETMGNYDGFLFGCPAMGCEVLEEAEFEPFFANAETKLKGIPVGLFGSYGWGSGEWMQAWLERCENAGAKVFGDGVIINNEPDADGIAECTNFAIDFVKNNS